LGISWTAEIDIHYKIIHTGRQNGIPFFMENFLIAAWELWKIRNRQVFDGVHAAFSRWLRNFNDEAALQSHRLKDDDRRLVCLWLDAL